MNRGDSLYVFTDGVAKATNAQNGFFAWERTLDALNCDPDAEQKTVLSKPGCHAFRK